MRHAFWQTARSLLAYRLQFALVVSGALISAACFGAGLSMLLPVFQLFFNPNLGSGQNPLRTIIDKRIGGGADSWRRPMADWLGAHVPDDVYMSFLLVIAIIAVLTVIGSLGRYIHEYNAITVTQQAAVHWRDRLYRRLICAPIGRVPGAADGSFAGRVIVDVNVLTRGLLAILGKAVGEVLKGAAALVVALLVDWRLTLIALIAAPIIAILLNKFGRVIRRASKQALKQQGHMLRVMGEVFAGLMVVKTQGAEGYERRRFRHLNRDLFRAQMRMRKVRAMSSPVIETLTLLAVMATASIAAWYIFRQGVEPERFLTVLIALVAAGASLKPLTSVYTQIRESDAAASRILRGVDLAIEPILFAERSKKSKLARHRDSVSIETVTYQYPGADRPALRGVELSAGFGSTTAIVGPNGAGKSTLLSLLPRLIAPTEGRVRIDGTDIADVDLRSLRDQIAVVTQQTVLFEGTIANNIAYGRGATPRSAIEEAARAAFAHDFIALLPDGYDTVLGERGEGLSGGQRQRLCIARAILRDPAILILDEATSQIDSDSEAKIARALAVFRQGRTTFVIAHRLSTVIDADLIVLMADGMIHDRGSHEQLLDRCELYRMLTHQQLQPIA